MDADFKLFESLLWEPGGGFFLLERHLERLQRSASHFLFTLDIESVRNQLLEYGQALPPMPGKVRLFLSRDGVISLEHESVKPSTPVAVALAANPIDSRDEFLRHKTTRRDVYDSALAAHPEVQDVLLWNERRELTETCFGNIVLEIGGRRLTPPLSCGLLPGVFRAHLLECGEIHEQILPLESIQGASAMLLINSVRRYCEIRCHLEITGHAPGKSRAGEAPILCRFQPPGNR